MSKYVKDLISKEVASRLEGVSDALLVNVIGMENEKTCNLRKQLRAKNIELMVVKNSLARRAVEGTPLAPAFEALEGSLAIMWGGDDIISLAKEVASIVDSGDFEPFEARGGVMDGEALSPDKVKEISKWPNRAEQLSLLVGQILGPGATLNAQLLGPGGALASQIEQKSKEDGDD
jgi:large subunit ribosomal protein L10